MKTKFPYLLCLLVALLSCEKWDFDRARFSQVITVGAIAVGTNDAFLIGDLENLRDNAVVERGFVISNLVLDENQLQIGEANTLTEQAAQRDTVTSDQAFAARVADLTKSTTYYFRAYARLDDLNDPLYGQIDTFTTSDFAVSIAQTECTGQGGVRITSGVLTLSQGSEVPEAGLVWSNNNELPTLELDNKLIAEIAGGRFSVEITPEENQLYFVRAYLIPSGSAPIYSEEVFSFTTTPGGEWIPRQDFPGESREGINFSIEDKGYFGYYDTGIGCTRDFEDFWEFDPRSGWSQINYSGFRPDNKSVGAWFSLGGKGYAGLGCSCTNPFTLIDFYEYDPTTRIWRRLADSPIGLLKDNIFFAIEDKGYVGGGEIFPDNTCDRCDLTTNCPVESNERFYQFDPSSTDVWTTESNWDQDQFKIGSFLSTVFSIGTKAYLGFPINNNPNIGKDFFEFNPQSGWKAISPFPDVARILATSFVIRGKAYVGLGRVVPGLEFQDFFEFDPQSPENPWRQVADFPGTARDDAIAFSINNRAFVGLGGSRSGTDPTERVWHRDMWEYIPELCP